MHLKGEEAGPALGRMFPAFPYFVTVTETHSPGATLTSPLATPSGDVSDSLEA